METPLPHGRSFPTQPEPQPKALRQVLEPILRCKGKENVFFLTSGALLPSFLSPSVAAKLLLVPQVPDERAEPCQPPALPACRELGAELA